MQLMLRTLHFWATLGGLQFVSLILSNFNYYRYLFKFDKNILATNVYHFMSKKVGSSTGIRLIGEGGGQKHVSQRREICEFILYLMFF
jgi:hypothetical protein